MYSPASLSALTTRLGRLETELHRRQQQARLYSSAKLETRLPGADRWPEFARRTWIRSSGTVMRFEPYVFQQRLVDIIHRNKNTIVNKSRQLGVSETIGNYISNRLVTEPGFTAVVFSKTQQDSAELCKRCRSMLNSIEGERFKYTTESNTQLSVAGRGTAFFLPATSKAARGIPSAALLWLDEAAFLDGAEDIYRAAAPTLSMLGDRAKVVVTSTPDTETGFFGRLWHDGIFPDWYDYVRERRIDELNERLALINDDWMRVAIHYSQHPIYAATDDWAERTRTSRRITQAAWDTEYELAFGATDTQIYPTQLTMRCARGKWEETGLIDRSYVMGIDPNAGGRDYFCAIVVDITDKPFRVVAMYRENGRSTEYSLKHVVQLVEDFAPDRVTVEKQAMGAVIAEALSSVLPSYQIETFNTSRPSKITATDRTLYFMEHDELIYPDGVIPQELRAFRQEETGERQAAPGFHDDTVMALAIALTAVPEVAVGSNYFDLV